MKKHCARSVGVDCCALLVTSLALFGCSGGEFGRELTVRPTPKPLGAGAEAALRMPQDVPFSIAKPVSSREAGLGGTAEANSSATRDGRARAEARVETGGKASAGFQLGGAFANNTDRQCEVHVRVRGVIETSLGAKPASALDDATISLRLYARNGQNRLLRDMSLIRQSTAEGSATMSDRKDIEFDLMLGARDELTIYLAGSVTVEVPEAHSAGGALELREVSVEVQSKLAPAVTTVSDGGK